jgi:hypothetical protein
LIGHICRPVFYAANGYWGPARHARQNLSDKGDLKMIFRIWHGWTTMENADIYENLLKTEIFPAIASKNVKGYRGIQLLRRQMSREVEFITIMQFDSLGAVEQFAGEDYEASYVPDKARKVLARHDERSQHYEIKASITY